MRRSFRPTFIYTDDLYNTNKHIIVGIDLSCGHCADYTKGKGLFGKLKGVFWFDDIVVGNIKNGQVNKSYIVDMKE